MSDREFYISKEDPFTANGESSRTPVDSWRGLNRALDDIHRAVQSLAGTQLEIYSRQTAQEVKIDAAIARSEATRNPHPWWMALLALSVASVALSAAAVALKMWLGR